MVPGAPLDTKGSSGSHWASREILNAQGPREVHTAPETLLRDQAYYFWVALMRDITCLTGRGAGGDRGGWGGTKGAGKFGVVGSNDATCQTRDERPKHEIAITRMAGAPHPGRRAGEASHTRGTR